MVDDRSVEARSRGMSAVRNKNTIPEVKVRRILHRMGYRFRLHVRDLPGNPDVVLPRHKMCIFVHGCFWHQHSNCSRATLPSSNTEFWRAKFEKNRIRDQAVQRELEQLGWRVCVIWTCFLSREVELAEMLVKCIEGGSVQN